MQGHLVPMLRPVATAALLAAPLLVQAQCGGDASVHQALLESVRHGIVKLETLGGPDELCRSESTGFIVAIDKDALLIATARHAMPEHEQCKKAGVKLYARFPQSPGKLVELTLKTDSRIDLALYQASAADVAVPGAKRLACPLPLGNHLRPIDQIVFFGYFPGDIKQALPYSGRIDDDPIAGGHKQRICGPIDKGTSGGPAFGSKGQVVGVVTERMLKDAAGNAVVGKGWIVPAEDAKSTFAGLLPAATPGAAYCSQGAGFDLTKAATPELIKSLPQTIEVPYHLSKLREDHDPLQAADAAKWAAAQLAGNKGAQVRYPRTYYEKFAAVDGYGFDAVSGIELLSRNLPSEPAPSVKCESKEDCIQFSDNRRTMIINYRLWSGPKGIDETRGWIDMVIKTRQSKQ